MLTRREVLQQMAACGVSLTLPPLDLRAAERRGPERPRSLILLWMNGGQSQLESWDPHPGTKIGGPVRAIKTAQPGLQIAEFYPRTAEQMAHLAVIRSLVSKEGDHERGTYTVKTGYRPDPTLKHPTLGAILQHELDPAGVEIPRHISIGESAWPGWGGYFGPQYDAFKIFNPDENLHNLGQRVAAERQKRRLANLDVVASAFSRRRARAVEKTLHADAMQRALTMMGSDQLKAFRVDDEPAAVRAAYGDTPFGKGVLMARRLVETGVRAVEVTLNGWDTHANNYEFQKSASETLDPALAALVDDLRARDLWDSTLVLCLGEFGRTPAINPLEGRDHWPQGFSCVVGGCGLRGGQVIGATDPAGAKKEPQDPIPVADLAATVLQALGVDFMKEILTPIGRPMLLSHGVPIARLLPDGLRG